MTIFWNGANYCSKCGAEMGWGTGDLCYNCAMSKQKRARST